MLSFIKTEMSGQVIEAEFGFSERDEKIKIADLKIDGQSRDIIWLSKLEQEMLFMEMEDQMMREICDKHPDFNEALNGEFS